MSLLQQDTLHHAQPVVETSATDQLTTEETPSVVSKPMPTQKKLTPYQVLRQLPADATPAQQDSAIQANFHPENTHLSERPDTLHLPGHDKGKSYKDEVIIPFYYKEHFFANDSLLREEVGGGRYGVAGDPKPYTSRNDDVITSLLLVCFVITVLAFSRSMAFIARQAKDFFYVHHNEDAQIMTETTGEFRFQFFLVAQTCLLLALLVFFYTLENVANTFILQSQYQLVAIFTGCFIAYYLLKALLYEMVNMVFYDKKKNELWFKSQLFTVSMMGIALFPIVMLRCYFNLPMQTTMICVIILLILVKISSFYKCFVIFFRHNTIPLQIILYFCALEIVPLLSLAGVLVSVVDYLKIKY